MLTHPAIVDEDTLAAMSGYERRADIERWLRENRVQYLRGKGGRLSTTVGLIEAAKGGGSGGDRMITATFA